MHSTSYILVENDLVAAMQRLAPSFSVYVVKTLECIELGDFNQLMQSHKLDLCGLWKKLSEMTYNISHIL